MAEPVSFPAEKPLVTLTRPKEHLWMLEIHNGPDNILSEVLIRKAILPALDTVEREWRVVQRAAVRKPQEGRGALIIVGKKDQDKIFSFGLDFPHALKDPGNFFGLTYDPMIMRLLSFPLPTIAAINGHCFAGGLMLSLCCDYRVMTDGSARNAWLCMNEIHISAPWPHSFAAVLTNKIGDHRLRRQIALEGHRFSPQEALELGLVDYIVKGKTADILAKAEELAEKVAHNASFGVYGLIRENLHRSVFNIIHKDRRLVMPSVDDAAARSKL